MLQWWQRLNVSWGSYCCIFTHRYGCPECVAVFLAKLTEAALDWFSFCTCWAQVTIDIKIFKLTSNCYTWRVFYCCVVTEIHSQNIVLLPAITISEHIIQLILVLKKHTCCITSVFIFITSSFSGALLLTRLSWTLVL
jgi:hypothetical protein